MPCRLQSYNVDFVNEFRLCGFGSQTWHCPLVKVSVVHFYDVPYGSVCLWPELLINVSAAPCPVLTSYFCATLSVSFNFIESVYKKLSKSTLHRREPDLRNIKQIMYSKRGSKCNSNACVIAIFRKSLLLVTSERVHLVKAKAIKALAN